MYLEEWVDVIQQINHKVPKLASLTHIGEAPEKVYDGAEEVEAGAEANEAAADDDTDGEITSQYDYEMDGIPAYSDPAEASQQQQQGEKRKREEQTEDEPKKIRLA